jgi:hypothetical protein
MKTTLEAEAQLQSTVGYRTLFKNPIDRRRTIISVLALTTQAASGAMFVICEFDFLAPPRHHILMKHKRTAHTSSKWPA